MLPNRQCVIPTQPVAVLSHPQGVAYSQVHPEFYSSYQGYNELDFYNSKNNNNLNQARIINVNQQQYYNNNHPNVELQTQQLYFQSEISHEQQPKFYANS